MESYNTLSQYKVFHTVAVLGNISKAAEKLFISQPAISNWKKILASGCLTGIPEAYPSPRRELFYTNISILHLKKFPKARIHCAG